MRYLYFLILSTIFLSCSGSHKVEFEEGNFSVRFPAKPESQKFEVKMAAGPTDVHIFNYQSEDNLIHYQAAYNYMVGDDVIIPDTLFQNLIAGPAMQLKPMSIQKEDLKIEGHPGARYRLLGVNSATVYDIYLIDRDVYQLAIINYEPRIPTDAEIKAFMGSFKLLGK